MDLAEFHDPEHVLDVIEVMVREVMNSLSPGEELQPVAFLISDRDPVINVAELRPAFRSEFTKAGFAAMAPAFAKTFHAHTVVLVSEAWMTTKERDSMDINSPDFVRPSQDPERQEQVLIHLESKAGDMRSRSYPIIVEGDKRLMGESQWNADRGTIMSIFRFFPADPS